jgi:hypothetical protein
VVILLVSVALDLVWKRRRAHMGEGSPAHIDS